MASSLAPPIPQLVLPRATTARPAFKAGELVHYLTWLVFPITIGFAITRQSLWIDEGFTAWFASAPDFQSFVKTMIGSRGAPGDPQFVFYLLHVWGWIKLFGASEISLRAANIPFAVIYVCAISWASRRLFWDGNLWALFCLSPFFWFYLNEARLYAALIAFSAVACVSVLAYLVDPKRFGRHAPWCCLIALFLSWGMHILAFFLFPVLMILVCTATRGRSESMLQFLRDWRRPALYLLPPFLALFAFYVWVSGNGVNKTEGSPGLSNLAFALYEFFGFAGLGPPRNDLRETQNLSVFRPYWPLLLIGALVLLAVACSTLRRSSSRLARCLAFSVACGFALALLVSLFEHHQVLGRHLAVLFPPFLMIPMLPSARSSKLGNSGATNLALAAVAALAMVWGLSDLRLVFLNKYAKDAYREACRVALEKSRKEDALIIWAADAVTARYYGIAAEELSPSPTALANSPSDRPMLDRVVLADTWNFEQASAHLAAASAPTILVLSKPDVYDRNNTWSKLIREQRPEEVARLNGLSIYQWQPLETGGRSSSTLPGSELVENTGPIALDPRDGRRSSRFARSQSSP